MDQQPSYHSYESEQDHNRIGSIVQKKTSLYWRTLAICLGSLFVGFSLVYYKTLRQITCDEFKCNFQDFCNDGLDRNYSAIIPGAAFLGSALICGLLQKLFSRRWTLIVNCGIGIAGSILILISFLKSDQNNNSIQLPFNEVLFLTGRGFHGLAVGVFMTFCLLLINEYSPVQKKLFVIGIYQLSIEIGIMLTNIFYPLAAQYITKTESSSSNISIFINYNIITICLATFPLFLQIFLLMFVFKQQTPQYLIENGKYQEAKSLILSLYKPDFALQKYIELRDEQEVNRNSVYEQFDQKCINYKALFLGIFAIMTQQMSGVNYLNTHGLYQNQNQNQDYKDKTYINLKILMTSLPEILQFIGTGTLLIMSRYRNMRFLILKAQRKSLIRLGSGLSCIIMDIAFVYDFICYFKKDHDHSVAFWLVLQCVFMFIFGFTLGIVCWLYVSQMLNSNQLRFIVAAHWVLAFINCYVFTLIPIQKDCIITGTLFLTCLGLSTIHHKCLIETKNKSKLEIYRHIDAFEFPCTKKK